MTNFKSNGQCHTKSMLSFEHTIFNWIDSNGIVLFINILHNIHSTQLRSPSPSNQIKSKHHYIYTTQKPTDPIFTYQLCSKLFIYLFMIYFVFITINVSQVSSLKDQWENWTESRYKNNYYYHLERTFIYSKQINQKQERQWKTCFIVYCICCVYKYVFI